MSMIIKNFPIVFDKFMIERLILSLQSYVLYLGVYQETKEQVLIKIFNKESTKSSLLAEFQNRCALFLTLKHPHLYTLHHWGECQGHYYLALEFINGMSLMEFFREEEGVHHKRAVRMIIEIALAIKYLHDNDIIHGSLNPHNILVDFNGFLKLQDIGLEWLLCPALLTASYYEAPELKNSPPSYASDIYSVGIIAYELLIGKQSNSKIIIERLPEDLRSIIGRAVEEKPEDRFQQIDRFIDKMNSYVHSKKIAAENKKYDTARELYAQIQNIQSHLVPKETPDWLPVEIGMINHLGYDFNGVYFDFFRPSNDTFGIIISESVSKGIVGLAWISLLRGIFKSLQPECSDPAEITKKINQILCNDTIDEVFVFSLLILDPRKNLYRFISCGFGNLWHQKVNDPTPIKIQAENIGVGVEKSYEFKEVQNGWNIGDKLMLNTFSVISSVEEQKKFTEADFEKALLESYSLNPKQTVKKIFSIIKRVFTDTVIDPYLVLVSLERKK